MAFVCGEYGRVPVVLNTLEQRVSLSVKYGNGQSISAEFPPGARSFSPVEGIAIDEIEVRIKDEILLKVGRAELDRLSTLPAGTRVMWEIHENGIRATVFEAAKE
jgi:hypothetical protein